MSDPLIDAALAAFIAGGADCDAAIRAATGDLARSLALADDAPGCAALYGVLVQAAMAKASPEGAPVAREAITARMEAADRAEETRLGQDLMALHAAPLAHPVVRLDTVDHAAREAGIAPRLILRLQKPFAVLRLDAETTLTGLPEAAWRHRIGDASPLEVLLARLRESGQLDDAARDAAVADIRRLCAVAVATLDLLAGDGRASQRDG